MRTQQASDLNKDIRRYEDIELSSSPVKKDSHEKLLNRPLQNLTGRQLEYSDQPVNRKDIRIKNQLDYRGAGQINDQYCFPKFLTDLGACCTPCTILCPCCCCPCCLCTATPPLYRQQMTSLGLLQEWGRFKQVLDPGLHVINPISQSVIDINQQTKMVEYNQVCISRDNVQFEVSVVVFYRIFDTLKAAYRLGNLNFDECVKQIANGCLRNTVGENTLQEIIENRELLSQKFTLQINKMVNYWGIFIEVCSLKEIRLAPEIQRSLQAVTETRRFSEALLINFKGQVSCAGLYREVGLLLDTKAAFQIRYLNMIQQILATNQDNVLIIKTALEDKGFEESEKRPLTIK